MLHTLAAATSGSQGCNGGVFISAEAWEWLGVDRSPLSCVHWPDVIACAMPPSLIALLRYSLRDAIDGARHACPQQQAKGSESIANGHSINEDADIEECVL